MSAANFQLVSPVIRPAIKTLLALLLVLAISSAHAEPSEVYVWLGRDMPEKVFMGQHTSQTTVEAVSWPAAVQMLALSAREAHANGLVNVVAERVPRGSETHWRAWGQIVTFRNPERLDRRFTVVVVLPLLSFPY